MNDGVRAVHIDSSAVYLGTRSEETTARDYQGNNRTKEEDRMN